MRFLDPALSPNRKVRFPCALVILNPSKHMIKKPTVLVLLVAISAWAADFWVAKPFTAWSEKEQEKMITDSHWAQKVESATLPDPNAAPGGAGGGGGGGRGGGKGGGGGGGAAGGGGGGSTVVMLWQSALPIKQALAKLKYGAEAGTSAEAKAILDRQEQFYVIRLVGVPSYVQGMLTGDGKKPVLEKTTLTVSGKEPLLAQDVQSVAQPPQAGKGAGKGGGFGGGFGDPLNVYFLFPRSTVFTVEDNFVEFSTLIGRLSIHHKFNLKDMVFNGKLEM